MFAEFARWLVHSFQWQEVSMMNQHLPTNIFHGSGATLLTFHLSGVGQTAKDSRNARTNALLKQPGRE